MDSTTLVALITAVTGSGILTAVANNVWSRRRNRADTAAVLNETALDLVVPLREQIKEMRGEIAVYRQRVGMLERRERERTEALSAHAAWDIFAQAQLIANNVSMQPMPPLFPASVVARDERTRAEDYDLPDTVDPPDAERRRRPRRDDSRRDDSRRERVRTESPETESTDT